jgi:cytochrome c peroxidase
VRKVPYFKESFFLLFFIGISFSLYTCKSNSFNSSNYLGNIDFPIDNQFDSLKFKLGKKLFFDKRLSADETVSCATCHVPNLAFTDGKEVSDGVLGRKTVRNSPSLLNSAFLKTVMFDGQLKNLEMQVIVPIQEHTEMAMKMGDLISKLKAIPEYQNAAKKIFNRDFDAWVLTRSIATYERTLISDNSLFDQFYFQKRRGKLSSDAKKGFKIFAEKLYCTQCHSLPHFTTFEVANNGYTTLDKEDLGRFRIHGDSNDIGKFKIPSLRNVALTAPYMHDGKLKSLEEVIEFYEHGGRKVRNQNPIIKPFILTSEEKKQLISFLNSLSDTDLKRFN